MYTFEHPATEQTEALTDYRYIGNNPYNYVDFNCDDNGENCETWRIVGVFTINNGSKTEQRIKLIRDDVTTHYGQWYFPNSGYKWSSSILNENLNRYYYDELSEKSKLMIEPAETYLGCGTKDNIINYGTASDMYIWERGTNTDDVLYDTKNITLLYPSDYTYTYANGVDNVCYSDGTQCYPEAGGQPTKGWLYNSSYEWWLVSTVKSTNWWQGSAFTITSDGNMRLWGVSNSSSVRPVVYLSADVQLDGEHTGSSTDHYRLKK